jgi:DNA mismatch repair protein MutH
MQPPPRDEEELLARARLVAGRTVAEVAADLGSRPPDNLLHAKGYVGQLCEAALGAPRSSKPEPDFAGLGIELKTLPLSKAGFPSQSTYVCRVDPAELGRGEWATCRLRHKIDRVLFMPYEGSKTIAVASRHFGAPFLWSPSADEEALLREDWEDFAQLAAQGLLTSVTARRGRFLQVRPKSARGGAQQTTETATGEVFVDEPRGFYLRPTFTGELLARAFAG